MKILFKDLTDINEKITKAGMSKTSFAKEANIHPITSLRLLNGNRNPSPRTAKKICDALGCDFDDIFIIEGKEENQIVEG